MTTRTLDTGTEMLLGSVTDGVATLTLNNPSKRNALGDEMTPALRRMLLETEADPEVRVLILTGTDGAFCAGGDISSMGGALAGGGAPIADDMIRRLREAQNTASLRLYEYSKPTIAALPGPAAGAGMSLALACDLRITGQSGFLYPAFGAIGLSGDFGGSWLLSHYIGPARAKEIYFTNHRIMPDEGMALGLFNRVAADDDLMTETVNLAQQIARYAPMALRYMKENHNRARSTDLRTAMDMEADRMIRTLLSDDHKEGARAFMEKRKPDFRGQ
ncbi:enoyl-CoA hydratase [Tropicibacter sp. Alg240-R139]|uniref:enoyl-CoA hydratase n=1 Tax=Tropicibacter sp. Alg240-R139 TaxID=2305991 RepID=UPI0013E0DC66|nr:enoyl-CoA hydratase [Tropicibacter sp. Alg240-R139]